MTSETRSRMVAGAADLMSRRGLNATSVREVVRHTGTPRGSISHHFPGGKQQLVEEAIVYAGAKISEPLRKLVAEQGAGRGLQAFIGMWRQILDRTRFRAGCPVLTVAIEQYVGDTMDKAGSGDEIAQHHLHSLADGVFADWQSIIATALEHEGVAPDRARRIGTLVVASVEGTVALCRAARNAAPLDAVEQELLGLIDAALPSPTGRP